MKNISVIFALILYCLKINCFSEKYAKIMNGILVESEEFPYMVSIQMRISNHHFCGGVLLNSHNVLTAAHCMFIFSSDTSKPKRTPLSPTNMQVKAGVNNLRHKGSIAPVKDIFLHEYYDDRMLDNDIAILRLDGKGIEISERIRTVNLSSSFVEPNELRNEYCYVLGWGRQCGDIEKSDTISENLPEFNNNDYKINESLVEIVDIKQENGCVEVEPFLLRYIKIPLQNTSECEKDYPGADITPSVICAGIRNAAIDSCKGDSGGPLICNDKLEGIISFGDGCNNPEHLGVYTRVYRHLNWINETLHKSKGNIYLPNMLVFLISVNNFFIF